MPVKTFMHSTNGIGSPEYTDEMIENRDVVVDGQAFSYGVNQTRNFADDGIGIKAAAFGRGGASVISENMIPFGTSKS